MAEAFVKSGSVNNFEFDHASSHFESAGGDGRTAGSQGTLFVQIGGIGDSEVFFSASWDWAAYLGTRHPCALVDINVQHLKFDFIQNFSTGWDSTAEVIITHKSGAVINAKITGGSVCEVAVPGPSGFGSNNEWYIAFEVTGGTKRFTDAVGTGTIHFFFDSGDGTFGLNEVLVHMD